MSDWIDILKAYRDKDEPVALVTVTKCKGSTPCEVGSRMIVTKDKKIHSTIGGGKLEFLIIDEAVKAISENRIIETTYTLSPEFEQCCGGKVELIIEPMNQSPELFIFGAGHIGVELCGLLKDTPFRVNLIDSRKDWLSNLELDGRVTRKEVNEADFKTFAEAVNWGPRCYVLVMTHDHGIDLDIIVMALANEASYVGLIGSESKRKRFHKMLVKDFGIKNGMERVVCPIGIPIGGNRPKEIAISVAAQLLQQHYN